MKPAKTTNAVRLLSKAGIAAETVTYPIGEKHIPADRLAEILGEDPLTVFKTILLKGERTGVFVCVLPAPFEINLKKAAAAAGDKKAEPLPLKLLEQTTGYIRGGCSPVGMKKRYPTFIHSSACGMPFIYVSAGARNMQMKINPEQRASFTGAVFADIVSSRQ